MARPQNPKPQSSAPSICLMNSVATNKSMLLSRPRSNAEMHSDSSAVMSRINTLGLVLICWINSKVFSADFPTLWIAGKKLLQISYISCATASPSAVQSANTTHGQLAVEHNCFSSKTQHCTTSKTHVHQNTLKRTPWKSLPQVKHKFSQHLAHRWWGFCSKWESKASKQNGTWEWMSEWKCKQQEKSKRSKLVKQVLFFWSRSIQAAWTAMWRCPSVAKPRNALEPKCAPAMRGASMGPAAHFQEVVLEPSQRQGKGMRLAVRSLPCSSVCTQWSRALRGCDSTTPAPSGSAGPLCESLPSTERMERIVSKSCILRTAM